MKEFLKKVDGKIQEKMEEIIEGERDEVTPFGRFLDSLILRMQAKHIVLEAENSEGKKEELMITQHGIYLPNPGGNTEWFMLAEINSGNRVKIEELANSSSSSVYRILQKALDGEVNIRVEPWNFYVGK